MQKMTELLQKVIELTQRVGAEVDRKAAENIRQEYYQKLSRIMKVTDDSITFFP